MNVEKIRQLNDTFRKTFCGGKVLLTCGISALSLMQQAEIINKVKNFNNFARDNDPYGEHDFGAINFKNDTYFWKIDYYDTDYNYFSPAPCDPNVTNRILTIMRGDEY